MAGRRENAAQYQGEVKGGARVAIVIKEVEKVVQKEAQRGQGKDEGKQVGLELLVRDMQAWSCECIGWAWNIA